MTHDKNTEHDIRATNVTASHRRAHRIYFRYNFKIFKIVSTGVSVGVWLNLDSHVTRIRIELFIILGENGDVGVTVCLN